VLDVLRVETDPRARERILADLEEAVAAYGAQVRTGNRVVDAVLVAKNMRARDEQVEVSFVVDGTLLDFMDPLDITAVLGNAVDNAIEAAARVPDVGRRSVRVAVFAQDDFVMIRVENPFAGTVQRSAGRIVSRKRGAGHGYGLRNIEAAVERYGGSTSISHEDQWFSLRVLLPRVAPAG
jgi:sensor histidine kinase regulating citrate/malate metabolism